VPRVCVIGIDGATFDLIRPLAAEGKLPTLSEIMREGASGPLLTVPGLNSAAAWSSFLTGKNPGKHGIFDFYQPIPGSYRIRFLNGGDRHGESLWSLLSREGRKVGVINVPMTFPAEAVDGFLVSGLDAPGANSPGFAYPAGLMQELRREVGQYTLLPGLVGYMLAGKEAEGLARLEECLARRVAATTYLLNSREWDFFMVVFNAVDSVQHCFWKYADPSFAGPTDEERQRFGGAIARVYSLVDSAVAQIRALLPEDTVVIVMSDHGAGPRHLAARQLNPWLEAIGLLCYEPPRPSLRKTLASLAKAAYARLERIPNRRLKESLLRAAPGLRDRIRSDLLLSGIDWARTKAFADPVGSTIRLNLVGREPDGAVHAGPESEEVLELISRRLLECTDRVTGSPAVEAVQRRDEAFRGPHVSDAPELVIRWNSRTPINSLSGAAASHGDFPTGQFRAISGDHRPEGVLMMAGPGVVAGASIRGARIEDLFPTILHLMNVGTPPDLDGEILNSILSPAVAGPSTVGSGRLQAGERVPTKHRYTPREEEQVRERLRGLGYLE
jgi:predicted AlkP superfamily phosphohydrolase/phosphomutase